ncbi:MAG: hypothetical protein COV31_03275, partial [Candidatus Yanofskybacteria bacterium CG10_big_fil_rev_8_21_14_0_10_46_23]
MKRSQVRVLAHPHNFYSNFNLIVKISARPDPPWVEEAGRHQEMSYFVYVLKNEKDGRRYIDISTDKKFTNFWALSSAGQSASFAP